MQISPVFRRQSLPRRAHIYEVKYSALYYKIKKLGQKETLLVNFLDLLTNYASLISVIIAVTNLYIVIEVFKFNRQTSQSKLSITPSLKPKLLYPISIKMDPKKADETREEHRKWVNDLDKSYHLTKVDYPPNAPGLPMLEEKKVEHGTVAKSIENLKVLSVSIKNMGDLASTNVHVKLLLKAYGTKNFYPSNMLSKELIDRELFSKHEMNIRIPYMGANEERIFSICNLYGQFRETELSLLSIKSNGFTYIKNSILKNFFFPNSEIILNHYKMDQLNQSSITEKDMKIIYGISSSNVKE